MEKDNLYNIDDNASVSKERNTEVTSASDSENSSDNLYSLDDKLYSLEDNETEEQPDKTKDPEAIAEEDNEAWAGEEIDDSKSVLSLLIKILISPVEGWKEVKRCNIPEEKIASRCFYPIIALAAVAEFSGFFYEARFTVNEGVIKGIITFITFFFSYFSTILIGGIVLPKDCKEKLNTNFGKSYVMLSLSSLAIFYIIFEIVPILGPILAFLPLWTIYSAVKGVKIFRVEDEMKVRVSCTLCGLIIGCPVFWNFLFTELLPSFS